MLDWTSTTLADSIWAAALLVMTLCSIRAWRRMDAAAWVPLQWGRDGQPVMRAQLVTRVSEREFRTRDLFDTLAPRLVGFARRNAFAF